MNIKIIIPLILLILCCGSVYATNETGETNYEFNNNDIILENNEIDFSSNVTDIPDSGYVQFNTSSGYSSYSWDFGDGTNSTEQNPTHFYKSVGSYNINLTVLNGTQSFNKIKMNYVNVYSLDAANVFTNPNFENSLDGWDTYRGTTSEDGLDGKCCVLEKKESMYSDAPSLNQYVNLTNVKSITFYSKVVGTSKKVQIWSAIDGINVKMSTLRKNNGWTLVTIDSKLTGYQDGRLHKFTIFAKTTDDEIYIDSFSAIPEIINQGNNPKFGYENLNSIEENPKIQFYDESYGFITGWFWDFGDGTNSTEQNPIHEYTKAGTFTVTLTTFSRDTNSSYTLTNLVQNFVSKNNRTNITYTTIQGAIDDALAGDSIICGDGKLFSKENIIINKDITLITNENFVLTSKDDAKPLITINSGNVCMNGLNISNLNTGMLINNGITSIANCSFTNNTNAIIITNGNVSIINNKMDSNQIGVDIKNSNTTIKNNNFIKNEIAIKQNNGNSTIISNNINSNQIGVDIENGISLINFNNFNNNTNYALKFNSNNININDNWYNTINPTFIKGLNLTEPGDIYQANDNKDLEYTWIVLNVTSDRNITGYYNYANIIVDLTRNNKGIEVSKNNIIPNIVYAFEANLGKYRIIKNNTNCLEISFMAGKIDGIGNFTAYADNVSKTINITVDNTIPVVNITPATNFDDSIEVKIECNDPTATIYYTLDGTNPISSSTRLVYTNPFTINKSTTVHYTAINKAGNYPLLSMGNSRGYPDVNIIKENMFIELWVSGPTIYYTLDGTNPINSSTRLAYINPFYVENLTNIRAVSYTYDSLINYYRYAQITVNYYTPDLSVTYLKNTNLNKSDAIWDQYQGNINHTGISDYSGPLNNITKWSFDNIVSSGSAVIDKNGHIYITGEDGYLYCLNNQGKIIWSYGTTSKIICTPTIGPDSNIYFTNWMNSTLYCLSPEGKLQWKYVLGEYSAGSSPVFGHDGTLYVISGNGTISTLFAFKDANLLWSCKIPTITGSTPAIGSDGTIYLVSGDHTLVGVNWDGTIKYNIPIPKDTAASNNPTTYISVNIGEDGLLYVLDYSGGTNNDINVYYPNGTLIWTTTFRTGISNVLGTPTYYNGILYVAGINRLLAINATNSSIIWSAPIAKSPISASSPLISADNIIYLASGNIVYAFTLNGTQIWNYTLTGKYGDPSSLSSPVLSDDGTLIVTTNQGVYAFNDLSAEFKYEHVNNTKRTIQFTDLSTAGNNSYYWDFGDGSFSYEQNPTHFYQLDGKYTVVLIVKYNGKTNLARNATIEVVGRDITPPSRVTPTINGNITNGGVFNQTQIVKLTASDDSGIVTIYYTVDGSNPLNSSTRKIYVEPIEINAYTILSYVAVDPSNNWGKTGQIGFNITDAIIVGGLVIGNTTNVEEIQKLFDNAEDGSKFVFIDDIPGAHFVINKAINIITTNNTKFIGNGVDAVFTINHEGATINGFTIKNNATGILINNTNNINIVNTNISANSTGINIFQSNNVTIKDSSIFNATNGILINESANTQVNRVTIEECYDNGIWVLNSNQTTIVKSTLNNNGKDWYTSKANQILLDGSRDTQLLNNSINYGFFGVHLTNINHNLFMDYNKIYEGVGDAILLEGKYYTLNITHNVLDGCFNGINFNGRSEDVNIENNLIQKMHTHAGEPEYFRDFDKVYENWSWTDTYGQYHNAIEVSCGSKNFHYGVHLENNACILVEHRAWEARHTDDFTNSGCDGYGYNLWDGSDSYHGDTSGATSYTPGKVDLVLDRIGDSSYRLRLINRLSDKYISEVPDFDVTFTAGGYTQTVKFHNGEAIATFDVASTITNVKATISAYISQSISWDIPITEGYNSSSYKPYDPGYKPGDAIDNPDPVVPDIPHVTPTPDEPYGGDKNNDGNGTGRGDGTGGGSSSVGPEGNPDSLPHQGNDPNPSDNNNNDNQNSGDNTNTDNTNTDNTNTDNTNTDNTNTDNSNNNANLVEVDGGSLSAPSSSSSGASVGTTSNTPLSQAGSSSSSASSAGGASVGDSSKSYEIEKSVDKKIDNTTTIAFSIIALIVCLILIIIGYKKRKEDDDNKR